MKKTKGKWLLATGLVATVALAAAGDRIIRNNDSVITMQRDGTTLIDGTIKLDTLDEKTLDAGVTIDSVLVKDNTVTATTLTGDTVKAVDGLITQDLSTGDLTVPVGDSLHQANTTIDTGHTYTINGKWFHSGVLAGLGSLEGTGDVISVDMGQNGDLATFTGDVHIDGVLSGGSPLKVAEGITDETGLGPVKFPSGINLVGSSITGIVKSNFLTVHGTNHTVLTDDGYSVVIVNTMAADRTVFLPAASLNEGRILTIKKGLNFAAGFVKIDPNGSETIDGALTPYLHSIHDYLQIASDGSNWNIIADKIKKLGLYDYKTVDNIANNVYVDIDEPSLMEILVSPGTWEVYFAAHCRAYFTSSPILQNSRVRLVTGGGPTTLFTASDGGFSQGTGAGAYIWASRADKTELLVVTTATAYRLQGLFRSVGGTIIVNPGLEERCEGAELTFKRISHDF